MTSRQPGSGLRLVLQPYIADRVASSVVVVAVSCPDLVSSPDRPAQNLLAGRRGAHGQRVGQAAELCQGQWDQPRQGRVLGSGGDDQERHREDRQGGPAMPGTPSTDLVLIESGLSLRGPHPSADQGHHSKYDGPGNDALIYGEEVYGFYANFDFYNTIVRDA